MTHRLAIVEDHGLFAQTVAVALQSQGFDVAIVDAVETADIVAAVAAHAPDVVLLDLDLGAGRDAVALVPALMRAEAAVVVVTGVTDPVRRARCIRAGALGVIDKGVGFDALLGAVRRVLDHGTLLTPHQREEHLARLRAHEAAEGSRFAPFKRLTAREAHVLGKLIEGRSVQEIAAEETVAVSTVRTQVRAILTKLGVKSQLAAIGLARQAGWAPHRDDRDQPSG